MTYFVLIYVRTYDLMILYYPLLASLYVNSRSCVYKLRKRCWYGTVPYRTPRCFLDILTSHISYNFYLWSLDGIGTILVRYRTVHTHHQSRLQVSACTTVCSLVRQFTRVYCGMVHAGLEKRNVRHIP